MSHASSVNNKSPWNTPVKDFWEPKPRLRKLTADVEHAHQHRRNTMPTGCRRPTKATMIAAKP